MSGALLTVAEVAARLKVSDRFVYDELRGKRLRGSKAGTLWRVREADLEKYLEAKANVVPVRRRAGR